MDALCLKAGFHGMAAPIAAASNATIDVRTAVGRATAAEKPSASGLRNLPWGFTFRYSLSYLWPGGKNRYEPAMAVENAVLAEEKEEIKENEEQGQGGNWVFKILHVKSLWKQEVKGAELVEEIGKESDGRDETEKEMRCEESEGCDASAYDDNNDDYDENIKFDRESFSKLLRKVPLGEVRLYGQMSYLGTLAYAIPQIKPGDLLRSHGLHFVTSSIEKKEQALIVDTGKVSVEDQQREAKTSAEAQDAEQSEAEQAKGGESKPNGNGTSASSAYQIAASAASYLHSQTKRILHFKYSKSNTNENLPVEMNGGTDNVDMINHNMASLMATTGSVTAVVAAKEEVKQAVADDLNSTRSSPCEWFVCDDDQSATRFFVIQGSESLASWKANLLFEPIQFEGLDVLVHRGIYEAAKGVYEQMLPEIRAHIKSHGDGATFRFTGHSLGGSLSLLVNLMLLIRGEAPRSSLLPVITFGAPSIMCGGDRLLRNLGLPRNHVRSISMHRDIVPRAFSCNYPNRVAEFLKAVNRNFRNHPCLSKQKLLYAPMGEFLILQPDEKFSPNHDLLPSGSGLYLLVCPTSTVTEAEKQIRAAQSLFLNSPHPLEILSDRSAYGSEGTIQRDHDMNSYLKSVRNVIHQELNSIRKARREQRQKVRWPLVAPPGINTDIIVSRAVVSGNVMGEGELSFCCFVQNRKESLKRFGRLVASQHMHLLVVLLFPAKLLILGTYSLFHLRLN